MKPSYVFLFLASSLLFMVSACNIADGVGSASENAIYMNNPNDAGVFSVLASDEKGAVFSVTPRVANFVTEPVTVTLSIDEETLHQYNNKNKLALRTIRPDDVIFKDGTGKESKGTIQTTINAGEIVAVVQGRIESLDPEKYPYDSKYAIPVKITAVEGPLKLLSAPNATIVTLNRKIKTSVMHMINPNGGGYSSHFVPNEPYAEEMTEWTLQFTMMVNNVHGNNQTTASLSSSAGFYNRISKTAGIQIKSEGRDGPDTWTGTFSGKGVPEAEWVNVAYVYRRSGLAGKLSVYMNGELQHIFTTSPLYLDKEGHWGFGNENLRDYYLREFRFWNRALSDAEILDKLYLPEDPKAPGLEAYFPMTAETFDAEKGEFRDLTGKWHFVRRNNSNIEIVENVVFPSTTLVIEEE